MRGARARTLALFVAAASPPSCVADLGLTRALHIIEDSWAVGNFLSPVADVSPSVIPSGSGEPASTPRPKPSLLLTAALSSSETKQSRVLNAGSDCWEPCGRRSGFCDFCGIGNSCCKKAYPHAPEECYASDLSKISGDVHQCVRSPRIFALRNRYEPSVFVAVFTRRDGFARRHLVRRLWTRVAKNSRDVVVKFAICDNLKDGLAQTLKAEQRKHGDLLRLDCREGYSQGKLTDKLIAVMQAYRTMPDLRKDLLMKTDDDTFVAWSRFAKFLKWRATPDVYMGVPINQSIPCRNADSRWYEPLHTYSEEFFPVGFAGGPGYVLGRSLVDHILALRLYEQSKLWNEDRAVSVWIDKMVKGGLKVNFVEVPGISGFWAWDWKSPTRQWQTWRQYRNFLHHGLRGSTIQCLAGVDEIDNGDHLLESCLQHEVGQENKPPLCE